MTDGNTGHHPSNLARTNCRRLAPSLSLAWQLMQTAQNEKPELRLKVQQLKATKGVAAKALRTIFAFELASYAVGAR